MSNITIPGLIDVHVHLRDPGQTHKEDFFTGTAAALSGGFTTILDMPNNKKPVTTFQKLKEKIQIAKKKIVCDVGFYFGFLGDNFDQFKRVEKKIFGLKIYLNKTTGNYLIDEKKLKDIFENWDINLPILFHAEKEMLETVFSLAEKTRKKIHICHVSSKFELIQIIKAKKKNISVTCGVTPHHLFLTENDTKSLRGFGMMKPTLKSSKDRDFLWKNLEYIDVIESDHAPHTVDEKQSRNPSFGVPGLETTLPLLLTQVNRGKLTIEQIIKLYYANPKRIFKIATDRNTKVEIDLKEKYVIENKNLKMKCGWSPFDKWKVQGKVKKVIIRGKTVFENDQIMVKRGFGKVIYPIQ